MADVKPASTEADLIDFPNIYYSTRDAWQVLFEPDSAKALIEASASNDVAALEAILSQPKAGELLLETQHTIYSAHPVRAVDNTPRQVFARPLTSLERALVVASYEGYAAITSILLKTAAQHNIKASSIVGHQVVDRAIQFRHTDVILALVTAESEFLSHPLGDSRQPLDVALKLGRHDIVQVLLEHGAPTHRQHWDMHSSLLARPAMRGDLLVLDLLLKHGTKIPSSGALHLAAESNRIEAMRMLIEYGANVDEALSEKDLPQRIKEIAAGWTPMHFAASGGHVEAMKLLEEKGASTEVQDRNGKTPAQILAETKKPTSTE